MKKHLWTAAFVLSAAMLLGGCGGGEPKETEEIEEIQETEETRETEEAEAKETQPEETEEPEPESVSIRAASPYMFSEGYAWVWQEGTNQQEGTDQQEGTAQQEGANQQKDTDQLAVVDTDGKIRFTLESTDTKVPVNSLTMTPFYDGASAVYSRNMGVGYAIYSAAGELLTSDDDGDDSTDIRLLAAGDGMYLMEKQTTSFSENSIVLYCIDKNGNKLTNEIAVDDNTSAEYIGNGLFLQNRDHGVCVADGKLLAVGELTEAEFIDMYFRAYDTDVISSYGSLGWLKELIRVNFYGTDAENMNYKTIPENGWCDRNLNLVIPLPTFSEGVQIIWWGDFNGGFAPIQLQGADGKPYITLVDETGNPVYEPVLMSNYYPETLSCKDGVIVCSFASGFQMIDKDGTVLDPSGDISAFTGSIMSGDELVINEGFKYVKGQEIYEKLDGTPFD